MGSILLYTTRKIPTVTNTATFNIYSFPLSADSIFALVYKDVQTWPVCTGLQYIYVSTCVPCSLLRFDIKLGFAPRLVLLLLSAREAIVNQTWSTSYLCLATTLTKFQGSLAIETINSYLQSPSAAGSWSFYCCDSLLKADLYRPGWRTLTEGQRKIGEILGIESWNSEIWPG